MKILRLSFLIIHMKNILVFQRVGGFRNVGLPFIKNLKEKLRVKSLVYNFNRS